MRAKKSFGQHFLHDQHVIRDIVEAANIAPDELVVEVGPGRGALTQHLTGQGSGLVLIEADRDLADELEQNYPNARLSQADAAQVDFDDVTQGRPWVFVSNLPYNAANAILMNALTSTHTPTRLIIMVQKEVADRMRVRPGTMSLLSVAVQLYTDIRPVRRVSSGAFSPPPKVESAVLALDMNKKCNDPERVLEVARAGFSARRKQLRVNITRSGLAAKDELTVWLVEQELSPSVRAQELTLQQWIALADFLGKKT